MGSSPQTVVCVGCRRHLAEPPWRPFCSPRCQQADLARWADGSYSVAGDPLLASTPEDGDEAGPAEQPERD